MSIEINSTNQICCKCGEMYSRRKGYFPVSYSALYKGIGYIPICRDCVESMYRNFLSECNDIKTAVRQVCRKLDLYWNESAFLAVEQKNTSRSIMTGYMQKINTNRYIGKSYDDTLLEEGTLWLFSDNKITEQQDENSQDDKDDIADEFVVTQTMEMFWGEGYSPAMYKKLEQRKTYWMSKFPADTELDIGTEALIRQICNLEVDIAQNMAAGKSIDRNINILNNLLGSASLKPSQKKDDTDSSLESKPFGVLLKIHEDDRPIPDPDPELEDVDGIVKYIEIWFKGHLAKMLGIKNARSKMYEEEMSKIRIEHPEYDDDDEEDLFFDVFGEQNE